MESGRTLAETFLKPMIKRTFILLILIPFGFVGCQNKQSSKFKMNKEIEKVVINDKSYFPFRINEIEGQFSIVAEIESENLYPKYVKFFEKHNYSGNGYCWEGHIVQILEKVDNDLLKHTTFDSEAGGFFAYSDSKQNQIKLVKVLSPIFADLTKLEKYVLNADRTRIED